VFSYFPRYLIVDLSASKEFVVTVKMKACFDSKNCVLDETIIENLVLPKPLCNFDGKFKIPGIVFHQFFLNCSLRKYSLIHQLCCFKI